MPAPVRLVCALTVVALAAPLPAALPAAAAPAQPACGAGTGGAGADLVRLSALDLRALGIAQASGAGLRLASTHAGVTDGRPSASARGVDATLAGVPLTAAQPAALRQTPGSAQVRSRPVDLGYARVGTGDLRAQAGCPSATASAALVDATVLPGADGLAVVRVPGNVHSLATVGTGRAQAQVGLTDVRILDRTTARIAVKVLTEPTLTVGAGSARYSSPVLEVTLPSGGVRRLDAPGQHLDLGLSNTGTVSASGPQRDVTESLPGNPLAALGGRLPAGPVTLRLSAGTLNRHVTGTSVTADAATLRVQLLVSGNPVLDVGVGVLQANASRGAEPATLPLTGVNVGWLVGTGLLLTIAGRFLLLVSRRRATS